MRAYRAVLLVLLAVSVFVGVAQATPGHGNGAMVLKTTDDYWLWFVWNDTDTAVYSSDPKFGLDVCTFGSADWTPVDFRLVNLPNGKMSYLYKGALFTRFYPGVTPDWDWSTPEGLCDFLGTRVPAAEGISAIHWTDINTCNLGAGKNTWYRRFQGTLTTPTSVCASGMARHQNMWHFMLANDAIVDDTCNVVDPNDVLVVKQVGPDLTCIGH